MKVKMRGQFHLDRILKSVQNTAGKRLAKIGYETRKAARSLIKNRRNKDKASAAGQPPYSHGYFKKSILYGVDSDTSVFIGPAYFKGNPMTNAGRINEFGGTKIIGKRHTYAVGKVGPIDISGWESQTTGRRTKDRSNYVTPPPKVGRIAKVVKGVAFVKLKTEKQVRRARDIDRARWPDSEKTAKYPARPYMSRTLRMMEPKLTGLWVKAVSA